MPASHNVPSLSMVIVSLWFAPTSLKKPVALLLVKIMFLFFGMTSCSVRCMSLSSAMVVGWFVGAFVMAVVSFVSELTCIAPVKEMVSSILSLCCVLDLFGN